MKKIHLIGLALVAVFAFSAASAVSASAAEWLVESKALTGTESAEVTDEQEAGTTLLLEDMEAGPLKQGTDVLCEGSGKGLLLAGGLDEQLTAVASNCVNGSPKGACNNVEKVEAVNLPWKTELLSTTEDAITAGTGGNPGWLVECNTALGKKDDTCTTNAGKVLVESTEDGLIHIEFMETVLEAEQASCTEGKAHSGLVSGLLYLHWLLEISPGVFELMPISVS